METDCASEKEADSCSICYLPYSNNGDHRLSCLKCGHIFGLSCINHWLKTCRYDSRKCPTCNEKATFRDVRILYAKNIIALDTIELDRLQEKLNQISIEKNEVEEKLNASEKHAKILEFKIAALNEVKLEFQSVLVHVNRVLSKFVEE